ncbi:male sterility protein [Gigaspora rosea]|uniref:Male sterility protein n=1 Tax=Gigaspora rosea TaxID=44941 RepID=A0A397UJV8_9GLOM|nr:male sterility protein [Gigaspora rosea]
MSHELQSLLEVFQHLVSTRPKEKVLMAPNVPLTNRYFLLFEKTYKADDIVLTYGAAVSITTIFYPGSVFVFPIVSGSVPLVNEILHSLNQSKANFLYTLPSTIEQIYKNRPEEIKTLLKLKSINYSGAALSPQIGEQLVQSGVNIQSAYGSTETGALMRTSENSSNIPWNAIKLVIPESDINWIDRNDLLDDAKELVIKKGTPTLSNIKGNTEDGGYRIGDLFLETPKGSELNYENIKMTPFLDITKNIFDSIHQANNDCPSHSRIFDEMVYILPLEGKTIPRTIKNNVQQNHGWSRLKDSFEQRHLDTSSLSKERVIILPSDLGDSKFGLTEKIYSNLVQEVTQIHHVAWRLDFNNKIETFERDNIAGTVHLLMLAREAYTHHTSSISTTVRSKTNVKEDELPHDISNAVLNGYGLSKFITENVCAEWSRKIGFKLEIHRVGQHVTWNEFLKSLQQSGIDFKIASNKEWLNTLLNTPEYQNVDKNPVAALSGFFEKAMSESLEKHEPLFETQKSSSRSLALSNCQKIDVKLIKLYVNHWKNISFLDS